LWKPLQKRPFDFAGNLGRKTGFLYKTCTS